jgi:hypothetical protein
MLPETPWLCHSCACCGRERGLQEGGWIALACSDATKVPPAPMLRWVGRKPIRDRLAKAAHFAWFGWWILCLIQASSGFWRIWPYWHDLSSSFARWRLMAVFKNTPVASIIIALNFRLLPNPLVRTFLQEFYQFKASHERDGVRQWVKFK